MRNFNYFSFYVYSPAPQELNYKNLHMNTFEDQSFYNDTKNKGLSIYNIWTKYTSQTFYKHCIWFGQFVPSPFVHITYNLFI